MQTVSPPFRNHHIIQLSAWSISNTEVLKQNASDFVSTYCEIISSRLCQLDGSKAMGIPASHLALSGCSGHFCFDKRNFDLPFTSKPCSEIGVRQEKL